MVFEHGGRKICPVGLGMCSLGGVGCMDSMDFEVW